MRKQQLQQKKGKTRAELNVESRERKHQRKHKGHKAGTRNNINRSDQTSMDATIRQDPRIGSKKPIQLLVDSQKEQLTEQNNEKLKKTKPLSAKQELANLEADERLNDLLDRMDNDEILSSSEQQYVAQKLNRIDELMRQLDIEWEDAQEAGQENIMNLLRNN